MTSRNWRACGCQLKVECAAKAMCTLKHQVCTITLHLCKVKIQSASYNMHGVYVSMSALHFRADLYKVNKHCVYRMHVLLCLKPTLCTTVLPCEAVLPALRHRAFLTCLLTQGFSKPQMQPAECWGDAGIEGGVRIPNHEHTAAATRQQQPSRGHMPNAASTGVSSAAGSHADHRFSSQPHQGVTSGPLGDCADGSSPAVAHSRMPAIQGSHRRSVQFATTPFLPARKDDSAKRQREEDAATPPPVQEAARPVTGRLPTGQKDMAEQIGVASTPGLSAQKASSSKVRVKKTKLRPSFVEGF